MFAIPEFRPGSDEARIQGCRCPVLDNGHGRGYLGDGEKFGWVISGACPIHDHGDPDAEGADVVGGVS